MGFFKFDIMSNKKSIIVTGAIGFIGSHLTHKLVELGANVNIFTLVISRKN